MLADEIRRHEPGKKLDELVREAVDGPEGPCLMYSTDGDAADRLLEKMARKGLQFRSLVSAGADDPAQSLWGGFERKDTRPSNKTDRMVELSRDLSNRPLEYSRAALLALMKDPTTP